MPSSSNSNSNATGNTRRVLWDATALANNRSGIHSSPIRRIVLSSSISNQENAATSFTRDLKRRKLTHHHGANGDASSTDKGIPGINLFAPIAVETASEDPASGYEREYMHGTHDHLTQYSDDDLMIDDSPDIIPVVGIPPRPIQKLASRGLHGSRVEWETGIYRTHDTVPVSNWQDETAAFYSKPSDIHECMSHEDAARTVPFCVEGANTTALIAVGDEEGYVRFLETDKRLSADLVTPSAVFQPHRNAVIDLAWSEDDTLIATGSGDQTGRIIDVVAQVTTTVLTRHGNSIKQIRFQPGHANKSIVATSGRDGAIVIWDLRCRSSAGPVGESDMPPNSADIVEYGYAAGAICRAHYPYKNLWSMTSAQTPKPAKEVSVTSLQFLPNGREHLLISAANNNAAVRLWDIRLIKTSSKNPNQNQAALSQTAQPSLHRGIRDYGVSSMNLSGDGSRLYTLCKDNTIFAYSTSHLILGNAPELGHNGATTRPRFGVETQQGLGPLYGYRHPALRVGSFYITSALRPARNGKCEMMAVGNSEGSPILFPTDERYHQYQPQRGEADMLKIKHAKLKQENGGMTDIFNIDDDDIPIYHSGTALVRGHEKEASAMCWTSMGDLVTVDDECIVRCWREDHAEARDLRTGGEGEGRRWGSGWAEVCGSYDEETY